MKTICFCFQCSGPSVMSFTTYVCTIVVVLLQMGTLEYYFLHKAPIESITYSCGKIVDRNSLYTNYSDVFVLENITHGFRVTYGCEK